MKVIGINGATAEFMGTMERNRDGSITLYATIEPEGLLFQEKFLGYSKALAKRKFKDSLQVEVDKYFA